jgi:TonB-linked SusC/RagA family outer membrane protein
MKTKTVDVKGKSHIDIKMEDDNTQLDELVVIGYGAVKKKDLTGAVATIGSEALQAIPVTTAAEALTGKLAGVNITTTEGSPDAEVSIRVRGGGSITQSNEPLYIVDGFPVESISDIPASDIEDITVLKDASSTAIYGSRGANGVILVTTKGGSEGKVKVSYNAYYSWKKIAKKLNTLGAGDYARWQYEYDMLKNDNSEKFAKYFGSYDDLDQFYAMDTNNWQEQTFGRTGHTFNHSLNITGGTKEIQYAFGYSHMNDKAIMQGSSFKRDNFSLKLNTQPSKTTKLNFQARYANTTVYGGGANMAESSSSSDRRLRYSVLYQPIPLGAAGEDDTAEDEIGSSMYNPLTAIADNDREQVRKTFNMSGSFEWEIFKNFKVKTEVGYDDYDNYDKKFFGMTTYYVRSNITDYPNQPAITLAQTQRHRFRNTNTVSYNFKKLFNKDSKHSLDGLFGHEYVVTEKRVNTDEVHGFPTFFSSGMAWRLSDQGIPYANGGVKDAYSPDDKLLSYFTRWNYNYDSKYYLTFTFRADGSSKFSKENRWGYFPSASVAWRISSEKFMEGTHKWLDDLKLRVSFGTSGNNGIDPGYLRQDLVSRTISYVDGYSSYFGPTTRMANPDLKWETTTTRNIGLDFSFFGSKLTGSIDYYNNTTSDLLMDFPMSGSYTSQYRNIGKTQNYGVEFSFTYNIVNKKDWGLSVSGNIAANKNKIKELGRDAFVQETRWNSDVGDDFYIEEGGSLGQIYGFKSDGRYEVSDFTGYDATTDTWTLKPGVINNAAVLGKSTVRPGDMKVASVNQHWDAAQNAWVWNANGQTTDDKGNIADGKVKRDNSEKTVIGNTMPKATGGFSLNARAYGFDLAANFTYSIGNDVYNANKVEYSTASRNSQFYNMIDIMEEGKRWTNIDPLTGELSNDPARLAELNANTTMWSPYMNNYTLTSWAVEDGSFLRLSTLTLGYTLPKSIVKKAHIENLRVYATCNNVFCITGYSGFDPEVSTMRRNGSTLTPGVDYSAYPKSRSFVLGVNLNF